MAPTDAMTIRRLEAERNHALEMTDLLRDRCEKTAAALKGADAEIARLRALAAAPRWWCFCERLNVGGEACTFCHRAKPAPDGRHA